MGRLSNLLRKADPSPLPDAVCRPVRQPEISAALRLILGSHGRLADESQVLDFLQFAVQRGLNVNDVWIAERGGRIAWAVLPIVSPGRTMLLLTPAAWPYREQDPAPRQLVGEVCDHFGGRGVRLAQALLEPADADARALYVRCGFAQMAELMYLQATVRRTHPAPGLPPGLVWLTYSPVTHQLLGDTIARTYHDSLDCPALNGLREMNDIIAGHKSSGDFDPGLWFMLCEEPAADATDGQCPRPLGVLLLSRMPRQDSVELVYLGLVRESRGRALGDLLMRQALAATAAQGVSRLTLAVDAGNAPALKLYYRHGMQRVGMKVALMRELSANPVVFSQPTDAALLSAPPPPTL